MIDILLYLKKPQTKQCKAKNPTTFFSIINVSCLCLKVLDSNPLPGMMITPSEGVVPVGGHADLKICFTPNAKMSFDTRVEVFKTGRTLSFECYVLCLCVEICAHLSIFWILSPVF